MCVASGPRRFASMRQVALSAGLAGSGEVDRELLRLAAGELDGSLLANHLAVALHFDNHLVIIPNLAA